MSWRIKLSRQLVGPESPRPKKFKTQPSAGKVMATVFWDAKCVIMLMRRAIPHPAYSPDLAPSDFFLFPNLKKDISGCNFRSDEEVVTAVEEWVNGKDPDFCILG